MEMELLKQNEKTTPKIEQFASSVAEKVSSFVNEKERTAELVFSTEDLVAREVYLSGGWKEVYIQLAHESGSVDLSRLNDNAPLLWMHDGEQIIGVVEDAKIDLGNKKGKAKVRFSKGELGEKIFKEVLDGIVTKVSVGFERPDYEKDAEQVGDKDGRPILRVKHWFPVEMSMVSIPAINNAKVGNSLVEGKVSNAEKEEEARKASEILKAKEEEEKQNLKRCNVEEKEMQEKIALTAKESRESEQKRVREIYAMSESNSKNVEGLKAMADEAVGKGISPEAFGMQILAKIQSKPIAPASEVGLSKKETETYSVSKVLRALFEGRALDGLEAEASKAISNRVGKAPRSDSSFFLPAEIQRRKLDLASLPHEEQARIRERFALQVSGTGAYLVAQNHDAAGFIDLLYAESMAPQLGLTMLPGLTGDMDIPRLSTGHTGYWVGESLAPTASTTVLGRVLLQPKTVSGRSEVSRKLIKQATPAVETMLLRDLARAIADAVDVAITQGLGSSNQPTGLAKALTDASITAQTCTTVDYSKILAFITGLQTAKAYRPGVKWVTTPTVAAVLNNKMKVSTVWSPIYDMDTKSMIGSPVTVTPNCKASHLFFGLWSDMIMADWGMVELEMVNSTATPDNGDKTLRAFFDVDLGVRRPASFQWSSAVSA